LEIRDPIHGSIEITPAETAVIDSAFVQRLRNIKQMGFAEFSFPGATHNRYCHSLGAMHLAGQAFDQIFQGYPFSSKEVKWRLRQTVRLASLLHDVGHGPLSHTTEEVMPPVADLKIKIYPKEEPARRANHEDYTIKIVTDSSLSPIIKDNFSDLKPQHVARLIDKHLIDDDDFFKDKGVNLRPLLSQIVSSELDVDRMDYLARDSYYCGTSYGHVDSDWLIANLTYHQNGNDLNLALNRKALYTFDDFLISRYHMYLMVYFHHKGIIYDEMLLRYLRSPDCEFRLPADVEEYIKFDDYRLHAQMSQSKNYWAKAISERRPFRMLLESHEQKGNEISLLEKTLEKEKIKTIRANSTGRLSKYYSGLNTDGLPIFVIDRDWGSGKKATKIEHTTEVFGKYHEARRIERLYVSREEYPPAEEIARKLSI
jgi:HD superfamily phosphohydrolase